MRGRTEPANSRVGLWKRRRWRRRRRIGEHAAVRTAEEFVADPAFVWENFAAKRAPRPGALRIQRGYSRRGCPLGDDRVMGLVHGEKLRRCRPEISRSFGRVIAMRRRPGTGSKESSEHNETD